MKRSHKLAARKVPKPEAPVLPAPKINLPRSARARRIAVLSTACAVVLSVGAGSAMFVDYLADRAMARATDTVPVAAVREIRVASDSTVASDGNTETADTQPVVRPPEIVTAPPILAASENAIEIPRDDPTAEPVLQIDKVETAALEQTDDTAALEEMPAPGDPQSSTDDAATASIPEPAQQPKAQASQPKASEPDETDLTPLPGVEVGGLAGSSASSVGARSARIVKAVNMRARGQKGAKVLTVVPAGTTVSLYGCKVWCEISYNGQKGWVYKSFIGTSRTATKTSKVEKQASASAASGKRVLSSRAQ